MFNGMANNRQLANYNVLLDCAEAGMQEEGGGQLTNMP